MKSRDICDSEDHISIEAVRQSATRIVPAGSLLIVVRSGILQRTIPVGINSRPVALNQDLKAFVPGPDVESRFLLFHVLGEEHRLLTEWRKEGATVESLDMELVQNTVVSTPPMAKQRAIAAFLDRKTAAIDVLIAKKERLIELLQEKRQALITSRVLPPSVEGGWRRIRIGSVVREIQRPVIVEPDTTYAEIGVRSHGKGTFQKAPVAGWQLEEKKVFWVEPGTLIFNIVFAWERAVAIIPEADRGRVASHRFPMYRPVQGQCDVRFLRFLFMSDFGRYLLDQNSPGAAGRNRTLDRASLMKEEIELPTAEVQSQIAVSLERETASLDAAQQLLTGQVDRIREYRRALISAAVTGKIEIPAEEAA